MPANQPPPPPPKAKTDTQLLQDIISSITANVTPTVPSASTTPQPTTDDSKDTKHKSEKWRNLPQEKQERIYEATLSPHVMSVAAHYRKKLEKDDLKRLSKEVAKKLVRGDYKSGRVKDPAAKISSKHEKTVKTYVKDFMDKAVRKKEEREKARVARGDAVQDGNGASPDTPQIEMDDTPGATAAVEASPNDSSSELKRKREDEADDSPRNMRSRTDEPLAPPPPPPPPPPAGDMPMDTGDADLTPMADGSMQSFTEDMTSNGKLPLRESSQPSPMQLATPPTHGSGEARSHGSSNLR